MSHLMFPTGKENKTISEIPRKLAVSHSAITLLIKQWGRKTTSEVCQGCVILRVSEMCAFGTEALNSQI